MSYNSEKFIKQVIENWSRIAPVHVYIDDKTDDETVKIVRGLGLVPKFFKFVNFETSRNWILSRHPEGYRIFIDDSYLFVGDPRALVRELRSRRDTVISIQMKKDSEYFSYSKITRSPAKYLGRVHEYINEPATYQIRSGYILELTAHEHIIRTLMRIPNDLNLMLDDWYREYNYRTAYYICNSLLLFINHGQKVDRRWVKYWLTQLVTMSSTRYKFWALKNLESLLNGH